MTFLNSCFKIDTLVGGFNPSEKYEFVSWDDSSQYHGKVIIQSCSSHHQLDMDEYKLSLCVSVSTAKISLKMMDPTSETKG